jgi:hypothetical protein
LPPANADSTTRKKQPIGFLLKLLDRDFSAGVRLQLGVELIVLLHTVFAGGIGRDAGAEFLEVHTDPVEGKAAAAMGTFDACQSFTFLRVLMNALTSSTEENTLSLLRELQGWQQTINAVLTRTSGFFLLFGKK